MEQGRLETDALPQPLAQQIQLHGTETVDIGKISKRADVPFVQTMFVKAAGQSGADASDGFKICRVQLVDGDRQSQKQAGGKRPVAVTFRSVLRAALQEGGICLRKTCREAGFRNYSNGAIFQMPAKMLREEIRRSAMARRQMQKADGCENDCKFSGTSPR